MSDNSDDSWSEEQGFPPVAIGGVDIYITPKPNSWVNINMISHITNFQTVVFYIVNKVISEKNTYKF